jgi:hypothetical protein
MKKYIVAIICILMTGACLTTANARKQPVPHMYMFGLAASFTDTIVHFTAIQELDSVWIESKNDFLQERDSYSSQLREYLNQKQQMPHRTCIVFYSQKRAKLEKKFQKIMRLYTQSKDGLQHFDVRHIDPQQFHFTTIDLSEYVAQEEAAKALAAPVESPTE